MQQTLGGQKKAGRRALLSLVRKYGRLTRAGKLFLKRKSILSGRNLIVRLVVRGTYPQLECEETDSKKRIRLNLTLQLIKGVTKQTIWRGKVVLKPQANPDGGLCETWHKVYLTDGHVSPNGRVLALVVGNAPKVVKAR